MACVAGSKVFGVFAACVLLLSTGVAAAGDDAAAPAARPDQKAVAKWLDRAEQYAASLPEPQLIAIFPTLCEPMAAAGKDEDFDRLLAIVKDPTQRADLGHTACGALGQAGRYDAAIRRAQALPKEPRNDSLGEPSSWRVGALEDIVIDQSMTYDFANAKKTITLIGDPEGISDAYLWLAESQAKAGLYAEADENLDRVVATTEYHKDRKAETRQLIARYKAARQKDPPRKMRLTCYESLRYANVPFLNLGVQFDNLAQAELAEKAAEKLAEEGAEMKAIAWQEIAWTYYDMRNMDKNNLKRCHRAIEKSLQSAEIIPKDPVDSYERAVQFAAAANLYLELGESGLAKQAAEKAGTVDFNKDVLVQLSGCCTQMLVAVLVRVGNIDGGREIAENLQKTASKKKAKASSATSADLAWLTWATACTLEGKTASVERLLEKTDNARTKAVLCAGVAAGLLELQQRPEGKKS